MACLAGAVVAKARISSPLLFLFSCSRLQGVSTDSPAPCCFGSSPPYATGAVLLDVKNIMINNISARW